MVCLLLLILPSLLIASNGIWSSTLFCISLLLAIFCALWSACCCLLTLSASGCGLLVFSVSLLSLAFAGGILPPVLLPNFIRHLSWLSPVSWFQSLAAIPMGYDIEPRILLICFLSMVCTFLLLWRLYDRRITLQEVDS